MSGRRAMVATLATAAWLACLPAAAQQQISVSLQAPEAVRPLLERYVRLLGAESVMLPEADGDRLALVRRSRREISDLLATEGYFNPQIRIDRGAGKDWKVVIEPGARATISEVTLDFEGEIAGAGDDGVRALREGWRLPVGEPFRQAAWDAAKQQLLDTVSAHRYAAAHIVQSRAEVDPDAATARLSLTLDSGPAFYLGELQVEGLEALPEDLVRRYSTLKPGAPYDRDALLAFQSGLQNTPHFASVVVDIDRDPALAAAVPVRVQVAEAKPKTLGFGGGFSTNTGYRVEASYRDVNLLRRGWELGTGLRLEQRRQSLYADVFLPPEGQQRDSFGALIDRSNVEGLKIGSEAVGVARKTVRGDIETQLALRLQRERVQPDGARASEHNTLTANWTWIRRAVDDLLDPRSGNVMEFQVGGGSSIALSDQNFVRLYGRLVHYRPVGERDVLILRAEGGATLAPSRDGIPQDFLFRTGGAQTVRGYAYQSLGVREGSATVGGRYLGVMSAEYVRWFRPDWGAAVFVDAGDATDDRRNFDLRTGYGVGARWRSPAGPLAMDLAWGQQEQKLRLHFSVAIAF
ncbi:autotransporter assembly complex family protein [Thauera sp. 2A1]|uniref:autotransporter assembly complex protein TamA n=1 Tax=Thauera sp. 2A1 TaxID=2570191 RepID=UPI0012912EA4|nr:autotransporter assembly complex family protein [Thauera sp. 2A1]KAI5916408.1 autotransporter assembly complex protein TamA [Thauera sp. 2A1]